MRLVRIQCIDETGPVLLNPEQIVSISYDEHLGVYNVLMSNKYIYSVGDVASIELLLALLGAEEI